MNKPISHLPVLATAIFLAAAGTFFSPPARAADDSAPASPPGGRQTFTIRPASSPIEVDGVLDEAAWQDATSIPLTHEWSPGDNTEPPVATECLVTFDEHNFYVAFRAHDPHPEQIRAYYADRDIAFFDDTVGFQVDTFNDRRRAFTFRVNALGVQIDGVLNDIEETEDYAWDAIWDAATAIVADGYRAEIAVPLKQLRSQRTEAEQTWGFLATRDYPRSVNHQLRSTKLDRDLDCEVCQYDRLVGVQQGPPGRNLQVTPTTTAQRTDARANLDQPLIEGDDDYDAGLSVRWGITPNLTVNATINPDFSQVEADVAQLDVNERFALSFPEKRPFFLDGADYFGTALDIIFTRSIADPNWGAKVSGKAGKNSYGAFIVEDDINNLLIPSAEFSRTINLDEKVNTGVFRYRRDVGRSNLGMFYTGREGDDYSHHLWGVDGHLRLSASDTVLFALIDSQTDYPDEIANLPDEEISGFGWLAAYFRQTRNWQLRLINFTLQEDFRNDAGFNPQVGIKQNNLLLRRFFYGKESSWYRRLTLQIDAVHRERYSGDETLDEGVNFELEWQGTRQTSVEIGLRDNREFYLGNEFRNFRRDIFIESRPYGNFSWTFFWRGGEQIDFTNVRQAEFERFQPTFEMRIGEHFTGNLDHIYQAFETEGDEYLRVNLTQTRLVYHINERTFLRAILQYQTIKRDPTLYVVPVSRELETFFSQFLFSYKVNPETVLFVGYSDNHAGNEFIDLTQRNRTFYIKLGYAWIP